MADPTYPDSHLRGLRAATSLAAGRAIEAEEAYAEGDDDRVREMVEGVREASDMLAEMLARPWRRRHE